MEIDKITELANRILKNSDISQKRNGLVNLAKKLQSDIPDVISACTDLINENSTLRYGYYNQEIKSMFGTYNIHRRCINLLIYNLDAVREYENDTEEKRAERKQKLDEYLGVVSIKLKPKEVIYSPTGITVIERDNPDLIYCERGSYRKYSGLCNTFEYRLCRTIQVSSSGDLKTLYQKVSLYIALKNELMQVEEEMKLLGIEIQGEKNCCGINTPRSIKESELRDYFTPAFKGGGNSHQRIDFFTEYLLPDLKVDRNAKEFARIALMIYNSNVLLRAKRPNTFDGWYRIFCNLIGCEYNAGYKPSKLAADDVLKRKFDYL